jgi:hypothetical protein
MRNVIDKGKQGIDEFRSFSMRHPGRDTSMYHFLQLAGTSQHTLPYFEARERAIRVANEVLPKVKEFIFSKANDRALDIGRTVKLFADSHSASLSDRPHLSYVINAKYEALNDAIRKTLLTIAAGPVISADRILTTLSKKPVDGRGMQAAREGLQNLHFVDEFQVICAVTAQFAEHADQQSFAALEAGLTDFVHRQEDIRVPLQLHRSQL